MAEGKAVIKKKERGERDTIDDGIDGLLATAGDPKSLAETIAEIQTNADRREQPFSYTYLRAHSTYADLLFLLLFVYNHFLFSLFSYFFLI